ncbi:hypothetical protein MC885_016969, partial [Smutsia gigantea]
LAGKLPYYCDAENGETPAGARGAVTVGIPSGRSAGTEFWGSKDTLAAGGADASPRDGSRRGLSVLGSPRGCEEFALSTRGSASAVTAPVGPQRPQPPTSRRPGRLASPASACWAEPGRGCVTDTFVRGRARGC